MTTKRVDQIEPENGSTDRTQRIYARVSGFLFLWLIITGLGGTLTISHIAGSGTFAEIANRVVASERLYRVGLSLELIECLSTVLLAFALYVTLKPVNKLLAQLAMYWRLAEASVGCVGIFIGFVKLRLYTASQSPGGLATEQAQALLDLARKAGSAAYNISAILFSIGSVLVFYLFFKSGYIPKVLSGFGVFASAMVTLTCFGTLIFPEHSATLQYGWAPMAIAEVATGVWLMLFAVKTQASGGRQFGG